MGLRHGAVHGEVKLPMCQAKPSPRRGTSRFQSARSGPRQIRNDRRRQRSTKAVPMEQDRGARPGLPFDRKARASVADWPGSGFRCRHGGNPRAAPAVLYGQSVHFNQQAALNVADARVTHQLFIQGIDCERRPRELRIRLLGDAEHSAIVRRHLSGIVHQAEKVQRAARRPAASTKAGRKSSISPVARRACSVSSCCNALLRRARYPGRARGEICRREQPGSLLHLTL